MLAEVATILATASTALNVLNKSADFIIKVQEIQMNFTVPGEVKKINAKLDQDITRKMTSGYESIGFALKPNRDREYIKQDLEVAREYLQDCLHLSRELETNGVPNDYIMGTAHYGLAIVYNLKGDRDRTSYHLFNAFKAAPSIAYKLSPGIYDLFFKSHCGARMITLDREQAMRLVASRASQATHGSREVELINAATEIGKVALKVGTVALGVAAVVLSGGRIPANVLLNGGRGANTEIDKIGPDQVIQARERARVEKEAEELMKRVEHDVQKQDNCCKQTAAAYLAKLNH